jgi:GntR family transcriptional regulator, transcriptional repressor for pyruvate dehydrogenase complex
MADTTSSANSNASTVRFPELSARKLSTLLADSITDTILRNGMQPGDRLPPEREMREQFGVGRGTLREALRVLEAEGLIVVRAGPHGGPVVARPDADRLARMVILLLIGWGATLRDVYDVRVVLEPMAIAQAATAATEEQLEAIRASEEAVRAAIDDEPTFIAENQRFHRLLAEASGNPVILAFLLQLGTVFDGYAMGTHYDLKTRRQINKDHRAITNALVARDPEKANRAARLHVDGSIKFLKVHYPEVLDEPLRPTLVQRKPDSVMRSNVG